jgi:hypothetical protein
MIAALILLCSVVVYRLAAGWFGQDLGWLPNFAPLAAVALCGAIALPRRIALALPLAILFVSDLLLQFHYGTPFAPAEFLLRYSALAAIGLAGLALARRASFGRTLGTALAGSLLFYAVANTGTWIASPEYAKSFAGWIQSMTTGLPGYPPAWTFLRNALVGDALFTALFWVCAIAPAQRLATPAPSGAAA